MKSKADYLKNRSQASKDHFLRFHGEEEDYEGWECEEFEMGYDQGYDAGVGLFFAGGTLPSSFAASSASAPNASVPEPASLSLLAIAAIAFVRRGSRK